MECMVELQSVTKKQEDVLDDIIQEGTDERLVIT